MAALLEDLRPVLDAYRNHGEEQVDAELSALDVCMEEAFYCLEYGWRAESFDAVLIDDPNFSRFRGRVTKDEAEYLRGMIRHVQRKADLLVGELCALEKFAGRDLYGCTVAELRELVDREVKAGEAERLEDVSGNMRRRGRPPKPGGAKGYAPNEDRLLAAVRIVETLRAGKAGTLGEAVGYCITHGEEEIRAKCKAFNDDGTTLKRWAKFNRTTVTELLGLSAEEWTERKGTLK